MPLPPDPVAFVIPGLDREVYWYGILVTLGTLIAAFAADREANRRGENPDHVWNALIVVMITGLIGARIYHVLSSPAGSGSTLQTYLADPMSIIAVWQGGLRGLGIIGAVIGGAFGLWLYVWEHNHGFLGRAWRAITAPFRRPRRRKAALLASTAEAEGVAREWLSFGVWADIAAGAMPLGQAVGRWGNYFNQELYGKPTDRPWGVPVETAYRLPEFAAEPEATRFHPTFLYESIWNVLVFLVLAWAARRWSDLLEPGDVALLYLMLYALGRYLVELQRPDAWVAWGVPVAQLLAVVTLLGASLLLLVRHAVQQRRWAPAAEE